MRANNPQLAESGGATKNKNGSEKRLPARVTQAITTKRSPCILIKAFQPACRAAASRTRTNMSVVTVSALVPHQILLDDCLVRFDAEAEFLGDAGVAAVDGMFRHATGWPVTS